MNGALTGQWADSLLAVERLHLLKLFSWSLLSIAVGTALLALQRVRAPRSALVTHFGIQCIAWGAIDLVIVALARRDLTLRDYASAVALDRFVWLNIGLDAGYAAVGLTLVLVGWRLVSRPGLVGAGLGVVIQGLALGLLDLQLAAAILR